MKQKLYLGAIATALAGEKISEQGLICSETYSGPCQTSKMERFVQNAPSWMSGMVMDMPLLSMSGI